MEKKTRWACAAAVFFLSLTVRIASNGAHFFSAVDPGSRNFEINDSSYQIRRTEMILDNYPHVPFYDSYHYFPDNPPVPWPPGYNLFLASVAKPFDLISRSPLFRESVIGLVPCFIDALTVLLFLFFFSRYVSFPVALLASVLLSLSPQNIGYSEVGYIDHHYFITFLTGIFCVLLYRYDRRPVPSRALLLGLALGSAVFFNVSAIQYAVLGLAAVALHAVMKRKELSPAGPPLLVFLAALLASFLSALSTPAGRAGRLQYDETSLFQFFLIFCCSAAYGVLALVLLRKKRVLIAGLVLLLAVGMILIRKNIEEGARFLFLGNVLNSVQGEEISVRVYYSMWQSVFSWFVLLLPLGIMRFMKTAVTSRFFIAIVALFFLHGLAAGLAHFLYIQYFYPWYALVAAAGWEALSEKLKPSWKNMRYGVLAVLLFQAAYVSEAEIVNPGEAEARDSIKQTIQSLAWLREHTPLTSHFEKGDGPPEYSVFAHRDYGHQIVRIAHRPALVSPFSTTAFVGHMKDYARATFSRSEDDFIGIMKKYKSRYLVLDQRDNTMMDFLIHVLDGEPDQPVVREQAKSLVFLFRNNLLYFDGELRWKKTPAVKHFRLIYEVPKQVQIPLKTAQGIIHHKFNGLKYFELVEGARILGRGFKPGERVLFRLPLKTNSGRLFNYTSFCVTDPDGTFTVTVPYSNDTISTSAVVPQAPVYEVERASGRKRFLFVSEKAVENGESLALNSF